MKKHTFLLIIALGFGALFTSCEKETFQIAAEERDNPEVIDQTGTLSVVAIDDTEKSTSSADKNVAIKVYQQTDGSEVLLVYNPTAHNLFMYEEAGYQIVWSKDYAKVGDNIWLQDVCRGTYTVQVYDSENGLVGEASYFTTTICTY